MNDEDLMDCFRMHYGEPIGHRAFDELYRKWRPRLYAYHFATTRNNATAAEELTQETFCRVIDKRHLFDRRRGTFCVWLYALGANLKNDFGRALKRRAMVALEAFVDLMAEPSPLELRILISECLDELNEPDREIIFLTTIEGFTLLETSRILNVPVGTLGRRRASAIHKLQNAFLRSAKPETIPTIRS